MKFYHINKADNDEDVMNHTTDDTSEDDNAITQRTKTDTDSLWQELLGQFNRGVSDADYAAAVQRVRMKQESNPTEDVDELVERLIRDKCARTAAVGAVTSGAAIIPGIGTVTSLTLGVAADIGATFKLQAELVLEIAAARGRVLSEQERANVVLLITGVSSGTNRLLGQTGKRATFQITERYAQKWVAHALPFVGIAASAATNVLSTYLVGKRADAYFNLGIAAMGDWGSTWRAVSGVDERALSTWFAENARTSWQAVQDGAGQARAAARDAGKTTGGIIVSGTGAGIRRAKGGLRLIAQAGLSAGAGITDAGRAKAREAGSAARHIGRLLHPKKRVTSSNQNDDTETTHE